MIHKPINAKHWVGKPRLITGEHMSFHAGDELAGYLWVGTNYHYLDPAGIRKEMYEWCEQQFGLSDAQKPRRWFRHFSGRFYFINEQDLNWFLLRWS